MNYSKKMEAGIITVLRICTILLAAVSFWSTAQGMKEYTFPTGWQAFAASLGIQGLLLGLNFALPSFLKKCSDWPQKAVLLLLTLVVMLCSSWFSYLYIAGKAYGESWDAESRLLAQSVYREELFAADEYIELYGSELEEALADQVVDLYNQALEMDEGNINVTQEFNWDEERENAQGSGANVLWNTAIDIMAEAAVPNAAQNVREQAKSGLEGIQTRLQEEIERLDEQIQTANESVTSAESSLQSAQRRLDNAPDDVDLTPFQNAVNSAAQNYDRAVSRQHELEQERDDYQRAFQRVSDYMLIFGMAEDGVSTYFVGANLREIQKELFQAEPNSERMMQLATDVFDRLQSAADLSGQGTGDAQYQGFLSSMNRFVQRLENYRLVKAAGAELKETIQSLANEKILASSSKTNSTWQNEWNREFNLFKAKISGLPVYTPSNGNMVSEGSTALAGFDRASSTQRLDDAIRKYLIAHNPAQQGIVYLASPYRSVAIFSLIIALLLDISAFITGVIIDRISESAAKENILAEDISAAPARSSRNVQRGSGWSTVPGLKRYILLTGNYAFVDGDTTYKVIENGRETEIVYPGPILQQGLYLWDNKKLAQVTGAAKLLFSGIDNGPQDGIYQNCSIDYNEGPLLITQNGISEFVANVDPNVPVYQMSKQECNVIPVKNLDDLAAQTIVIALSHDGKRVITLYIIS